MSIKTDKVVKEIVTSVVATAVVLTTCLIWNNYSQHHISVIVLWGLVSFEAGISFGKIQEFLRTE